jgi:sterol O-acyltransferase
MFAVSFTPCPLLNLWVNRYIPLPLYYLLYLVLQVVFMAVPAYFVRLYDLPIASSIIVMCEQIRLMMKMHSFIRETYKMAQNTKAIADAEKSARANQAARDKAAASDKGHDSVAAIPGLPDLKDPNAQLLPTASDRLRAYAFFLFCPTLIYRNEYPRTPTVRWWFFGQRIAECLACIFYT